MIFFLELNSLLVNAAFLYDMNIIFMIEIIRDFLLGLPSIGTFPGFIMYGVVTYIFSLTMSIIVSRFIAKNLNVE